MKRPLHFLLYKGIFILMLVITFSCSSDNEDATIIFNVETKEINPFSVKVSITHNGTNRDLYFGQLIEGEIGNLQEEIDKAIAENSDALLFDRLFSQRKKVLVLSGLSPEKTYSYIVFGIDENGEQYGLASYITFTTIPLNFTAEEYPNWQVTYQGQVNHQNGYYSSIHVQVNGVAEERFFMLPIPTSTLSELPSVESIIAYAAEEHDKENIDSDPDFWLNSFAVATTSTRYFDYLDENDYVAYAIGINTDGTPTGHYAKSEAFHVNEYPATPDYANLLGSWNISDISGQSYNVTITKLKVNKTLKMVGWGNHDYPLVIEFNQSNSRIYIKEQRSDKNAHFIIDGEDYYGELYMKGWYLLNNKTKLINNTEILAKGEKNPNGAYIFSAGFYFTDDDVEKTGITYALSRPDGSFIVLGRSKITLPFGMTKY